MLIDPNVVRNKSKTSAAIGKYTAGFVILSAKITSLLFHLSGLTVEYGNQWLYPYRQSPNGLHDELLL